MKKNKKPLAIPIREELLAICDGDMMKSIVLNQVMYWSKRLKNASELIEEERKRRDDIPELDIQKGWFYKSSEEFSTELLFNPSRKTVRKHLADLEEIGFIFSRSNLSHKWDKTRQYRLNVVAMRKALRQHGYTLLDDFSVVYSDDTEPPVPLKGKNESHQRANLPAVYNEVPEIKTEIKNREQHRAGAPAREEDPPLPPDVDQETAQGIDSPEHDVCFPDVFEEGELTPPCDHWLDPEPDPEPETPVQAEPDRGGQETEPQPDPPKNEKILTFTNTPPQAPPPASVDFTHISQGTGSLLARIEAMKQRAAQPEIQEKVEKKRSEMDQSLERAKAFDKTRENPPPARDPKGLMPETEVYAPRPSQPDDREIIDVCQYFEGISGIMNFSVKDGVETMLTGFPAHWVKAALRIAVEKGKARYPTSYARSILKNWIETGAPVEKAEEHLNAVKP